MYTKLLVKIDFIYTMKCYKNDWGFSQLVLYCLKFAILYPQLEYKHFEDRMLSDISNTPFASPIAPNLALNISF